MAVTTAWARQGLTGGTSTDLDGIGVASLADGDIAFVKSGAASYEYEYDSASTDVEASPDVIKPDDAGATGRWLLRKSFGTFGQNEIINSNFAIDQLGNLGSSTAATEYYLDGWFNPSGATSGAINNVGSKRYQLSSTNTIAQLFGRRIFNGATQQHGIVDNEPLTVTVKMFSGTMTVKAGYGSGSGSALTLVSIGTVSTTSETITYNADDGGLDTNLFAVELSGTGVFEYVKIERGSSSTAYIEPEFTRSLRECEYFVKKSYNYTAAPGATTNTGSIHFRNTTGGAVSSFRNIPATVEKMYKTPSITIYSPVTGTSGKVYNVTTAADVTVSGVIGDGENGFTNLTTSATFADNDVGRFHYVYKAQY